MADKLGRMQAGSAFHELRKNRRASLGFAALGWCLLLGCANAHAAVVVHDGDPSEAAALAEQRVGAEANRMVHVSELRAAPPSYSQGAVEGCAGANG